MKHKYSLVHLSDISCPPPQFIYAAAEAGYDCVSLRTIPMGLKGEVPHDIAADRQLFQDTKKALAEEFILMIPRMQEFMTVWRFRHMSRQLRQLRSLVLSIFLQISGHRIKRTTQKSFASFVIWQQSMT